MPIHLFFLLIASLFLTGCNLSVTNLTPETVPENPSNVYTINLMVKPRSNAVEADSIRPHIVIDGQSFPMTESAADDDIYEFDYHLPPGRQDASYYFLINYRVHSGNQVHDREEFTELFPFQLINRYALSLDVNRAPVGARVGVVGRGFREGDTIRLGGKRAETVYHSANSLSFHVPSLEAGRSYNVQLDDGNSAMNVGTLRVDSGTLRVMPADLSITEGERAMLVFQVNAPAPPGGLLVDVTTDVPDSVIMPEVRIPEGAMTVSVPIRGGDSGQGKLYVEMPGYNEIEVPITVRSN